MYDSIDIILDDTDIIPVELDKSLLSWPNDLHHFAANNTPMEKNILNISMLVQFFIKHFIYFFSKFSSPDLQYL